MDKPKRILVVDDSEDIRDVYELLLRGAGYEVETASNGLEGFERARAHRPDVIILDVVMPVMDGLELLLKLRSDLAPPIPPVILCSGFGLTEQEALRRGAVRFLSKPMEEHDLLEAIGDALRGQPAPAESVRRQREHSARARALRFEDARNLVARIEANAGASLDKLQAFAQPKVASVADYIGIPRGALAMIQGDHLEVLAATDDAQLPRGFDLGAVLPEALEVLESGSSLLLPDAAAHPFSSVSRSLGGIRFFAGAPLRIGPVPVGLVCLFDPAVQFFEGDELAALELFGRRGSDILMRFADGNPDRVLRYGRGVVVREMFDELLDAELRILDRRGGSLELAVLDVSSLDAVEAALARAPARTRLLAGVLSHGRVALFKRALDGAADQEIAAIIADLRATAAPRAVGLIDFPAGGVRGFAGSDLVHVAAIALDRAAERGDEAHRVTIAEERVS